MHKKKRKNKTQNEEIEGKKRIQLPTARYHAHNKGKYEKVRRNEKEGMKTLN